MNQSSHSIVLTPKGRNNSVIVRSMLSIGWSANMMNSSGPTWDANMGREADTTGEGSAYIYNTEHNTKDGNNINDSTNERQIGKRNAPVLRINPKVDIPNKAFEGVEPDIKCVLVLKFENV